MNIEEMEEVKVGIQSSFGGVSRGVFDSIDEYSRFIGMMEPYIDYFFSGGKKEGTFFGDVVYPSRENLNSAITGACGIMHDDSGVHDHIRESLERIYSLKTSVETILEMLELIETYSINTIIMSAKAGKDGEALSAISSEMSKMSQVGHNLSTAVTCKMKSLVDSLSRFDEMKNVIEGTHENSLTFVQLSSGTLFNGLVQEFSRLSGEVLAQYGMLFSVRESLKRITGKFQYEDIVRQNMEKILFSRGAADEPSSPDRELLLLLSDVKAAEIRSDIGTLCSETSTAFKELESVVNLLSGSLTTDSPSDQPRVDTLSELHENLHALGGRFNGYTSDILQKKDQMRSFLVSVDEDLYEFASFFKTISAIAKRFKTVVLLTSIELSRHDVLRQLLGGTLSDVRVIPDRISAVVAEGEARYMDLLESFRKSVSIYDALYSRQRTMLDESTSLIRSISDRVDESKTYHDNFLLESGRKVEQVHTLSSSVFGLLDHLQSQGERMSALTGERVLPSREELLSAYRERIESLVAYYREDERAGEYTAMMLASLGSEFLNRSASANSHEVDFF
jgi:hypothetical protein